MASRKRRSRRAWLTSCGRSKDLQAAHPDSPWAGEVQTVLQDGFALRDRSNAGEISGHGLASARGRLAARLGRLIDAAPPLAAAKHLANEFPAVFLFLCDPSIDATNWRAEQAIRPAVVTRKVCGGNRTRKGADTQQVLAGVMRTTRQRNLDPRSLITTMLAPPSPSYPKRLRCRHPLDGGQAGPLRPVRTHAEPAATVRGHDPGVSSSDRTGRPQDARRSSHCPSGRVPRSRRCPPKKTGGARASPAGGTPEGASPGVDAGRTPPPDPLAGHANRQADLPPTAQSARHNRQSGKAQLGYRRNFPIVRSISVLFSLAKTDRAPGNLIRCRLTQIVSMYGPGFRRTIGQQ